ncbi:uncharacterized protein (TIGR00369 family) [Chitinophaga skermanii]|uniref:Uncharacterized protein (TIGR00369 family) n=1 Tax=Chitinophaga skermanii TaxID=331697 RepID=A0A327QU63_9BACT|nr:PaaI family thioesterase [Chitinophaga skermanii]RAJ08196.1 uncharacterized protein (TIGR00369 family) [Chitinophaga skermanii]
MDRLQIIRSFIGKTFTASPSPFMQWLAPTVIAAEEGKLTFQYTIRKEWLNPIGNLHGGVMAAIMDDIIGATVFTLTEQNFYTTINNVIDYFAPAKEGDAIIAETLVIKKGKQFVNVQCETWNADRSRMLARGTSNLFLTGVAAQTYKSPTT